MKNAIPESEDRAGIGLERAEEQGLAWYVAHTRPRCEKKMVDFCRREEIPSTLPLYKAAHKYRGKTAVFEKPLFPGYVFLRVKPEEKNRVYHTDHLVNLLKVTDQALFERQLLDVMRALDSGLEIKLAPELSIGSPVRIKSGALRGLEGWVEQRYGMSTVLLRLDFIGQAAAVKLEASEIELI